MRIIDRGHIYILNILDAPPDVAVNQIIRFVKRCGEKYPGNYGGPYPGTTSQEVLRVLIDRAKYVNKQIPCWQTKLSILLMSFVVWLYEHRAAKRHGRKPPSLRTAVHGETCATCGHVECKADEHHSPYNAGRTDYF